MSEKNFKAQLRTNILSGCVTAVIDLAVMALSYTFYLSALGYDDYGVWLIMATVLSFLQMGGNLGVESSIIKLVAEEYGRKDFKAIQSYVVTAFSVVLMTGIIASVGVLIFKVQIIDLFKLTGDNARIASLLLPYMGLLCVYAFVTKVLEATLSALGRMDLVNYIRIIARSLLLLVAISLLNLGYGVVSLLIANIVSYFFIHITTTIVIQRKFQVHLFQIRSWDFKRLKKLLHFGIGFVGSSFLVMLLSPFNITMISRYLGPAFVPIYEIAYRGAMQLRAVVESGFRAIMPEISRLTGKMQKYDLLRMKTISRQSLKFVYIFGVPLFLVGIYLISNTPLLQLWLAERFVDELPDVVSIMFFGSFLSLIGVASYYIIIGMGFVRHVVISHFIQSSTNVLVISLVLFLDLPFSVTVIAWIVTISMGLSTVYLIFQERRLFSILLKKQQVVVQVDSIDVEDVSEENKTISNVLINGRRIKIAYCTSTNPNDKQSWSGLHYYIRQALEKHCGEVISLGPLKDNYMIFSQFINKFMLLLFNKNIAYLHSAIISRDFARQLSKKLKNIDADLLFFPGGSGMIAYLNSSIPIVYLTDATFKSMINYYDSFSNLFQMSEKRGNFIESKALLKATQVIFASEWAKNKAIESYGCSIGKISVLPFGANIDKIPDQESILKLRKKKFSGCTLLLVGVSWERKGCQFALDAICILNERGIETELIVCGCEPPEGVSHERLTLTGYLDKNNPDDYRKIEQLYLKANIFILPTRNECAGIVLCEASSYGLPIITTDTGGVSTYIENNNNGYLLPLEATAEEYANAVEFIIEDKDLYFAMALSSCQKFEKELNWDSWGRSFAGLLKNYL